MIRILVAEDNELAREWLCEELASDGHAVMEAGDGEAAAKVLREAAPIDILLTDIRMPGAVDGWELGEIAKQYAPGIRIVYVTGYSEELRKLGPNERMLHKPFLYRDVRRAIADLGS